MTEYGVRLKLLIGAIVWPAGIKLEISEAKNHP
jgi:hypothetical protein